MHFGHIGIALASRPVIPKVSFGIILIASTSLDILIGVFSIFGIEKVDAKGIGIFPWSHGLFMTSIWTFIVMLISYSLLKKLKECIAIGLLVFSHWVLDFISHPMGFGKNLPPDIPLFFKDSPLVGLGLFNSVLAALITEFGLLTIGLIIYSRYMKSLDKFGKWTLVFLVLYIFMTLTVSVTMPRELILLSTLLYIPLFPIGILIDRHYSINSLIKQRGRDEKP